MKSLLLLIINCCSIFLFAQHPVLVRDILTGVNQSASPRYLAELNGKIYFQADSTVDDCELWITDGTTANTHLFKDIFPGTGSSYPDHLFTYNGKIYFGADDGTHGKELWVTDGTDSGTYMFADIYIGIDSSSPRDFAVVNGLLMFTAYNQGSGRELWVTDGISPPTLIDIEPTNNVSSNPSGFINYNGNLYFSAATLAFGIGLYVSDGSGLGTGLVSNSVYNPAYLTKSQGKIFFSGYDPTHDTELWSTDGTNIGTSLVKDIFTYTNSSYPQALINYNDTLLFTATSQTGIGFWRSDGTPVGTNLFDANSYMVNGIVYKNKVFYYSGDRVTEGQLYVTDGEQAGTTLFKDFTHNTTADAQIRNFTIANNFLFFIANDGSNGDELWVTDGTSNETKKILPVIGAGYNPLGFTDTFYVIDNYLYFNASYDNKGDELYRLDLSSIASGVKDIEESNFILDIYPNPAVDLVTVKCNNIQTIRMTDQTGAVVQNIENLNKSLYTLSISHLAVGIYYVQVISNDGTAFRKLVVR